jgi:hypothetical protein
MATFPLCLCVCVLIISNNDTNHLGLGSTHPYYFTLSPLEKPFLQIQSHSEVLAGRTSIHELRGIQFCLCHSLRSALALMKDNLCTCSPISSPLLENRLLLLSLSPALLTCPLQSQSLQFTAMPSSLFAVVNATITSNVYCY